MALTGCLFSLLYLSLVPLSNASILLLSFSNQYTGRGDKTHVDSQKSGMWSKGKAHKVFPSFVEMCLRFDNISNVHPKVDAVLLSLVLCCIGEKDGEIEIATVAALSGICLVFVWNRTET